MNLLNPNLLVQDRIEKAILKKAKKKKQIIYGARAIQKQIGIFSRPTIDFDIFTLDPKNDAYSMEYQLDNIVGYDYYYVKEGMHKGTWKVKSKGPDMKKETIDDEGIVDYTQFPKPRPKTKKINGVQYRDIKEEIKAKKNALRDKKFAFRHAKDYEDLQRIRLGLGRN